MRRTARARGCMNLYVLRTILEFEFVETKSIHFRKVNVNLDLNER